MNQPAAKQRSSLRTKLTLMIIVTSAILSALSVTISLIIYINTTNQRYIELSTGVAQLMADTIPADAIDGFLRDGVETEDYLALEQRLARLKNSFPDITYMYVYQIQEDGCHVVFDLDTQELPGGQLGEVVPFDSSFRQYLPQLLNGEEIPPITSNDQYGWLLTVYRPILNADGRCVAYAAADISMANVRSDRYIFAIRMISVLLGASILIVGYAVWYAQQRLVAPINRLSTAASEFAYEDDRSRAASARQIEQLNIHTGDEIENLYTSIAKMMADVTQYVELISEKSRDLLAKAALIDKMQNNVIISFANMIENRDQNTGSHVKHTADYVYAIGKELLEQGLYPDVLTKSYLVNMKRSAPLHDVGKIRIPDALLNKPGRLTADEFAQIKTHTLTGRDILAGTLEGIEGENYLKLAMEMATYHHERWDGTGYPVGLCGEAIPLCARIMAVADVFDALLSRRSYKSPYPFDEALAVVKSESGTHFDPVVIDAFLRISDQIRALSEQE